MIVADGTNVQVNGSVEDVVAEYMYLTDSIADNVSKQLGMSKEEWLEKVFVVAKEGIVKKED